MFKNIKISPYVLAGILVWVAWGLIMYTRAIYYTNSPEELYLGIQVRSIQAINGIWTTLILIQIYHRFSKRPLSVFQKAILIVVFSYVFSVGLVVFNDPVYRFLYSKTPVFHAWDRYLIIAFSKIFVFFCLGIFYFLIQHWEELQLQKEKTLTAIALANEAQLQMLRYQLHPHFLFNALNAIRTLIYEDTKKADKMITDLSDFLRYSLTRENDHESRLKDEIDILRNYLDIQKIRFEDKIVIKIDIQKDTLEIKLPCFLIHPLVENAIKYGIQTSTPPLNVVIKGHVKNGSLFVKVSNSGKLKSANELDGTGTGLTNVKMRLNHFFPDRNAFDIFEEDGWVHAVIQIDLEGDE